MNLRFLALIVALVALAPAHADVTGNHPLVQSVVFDITQHVDVAKLQFTPQCELPSMAGQPSFPAETFTPLPAQHGFRFAETDGATATAPGDPPGYNGHGCGIVALNLTVPAGTEHIHVQFLANREASIRPGSIQSVYGPRFQQDVTVAVSDGAFVKTDYYNVSDGSHASTFVEPNPPLYPGAVSSIRVAWTFADRGTEGDASLTKLYSGGAYAATITNASVEFSSVAIPAKTISESDRRSEAFVFHDVAVAVPVGAELLADQDTDLRIRLDPSVSFVEVQAPDGARITDRSTRTGAGPLGFDHSRVLLERLSGYTQITVPAPVLRAHGSGTYILIETQQTDVRAIPALVPFAVIMLLLPFPFAAIAFVNVRIFEREAFGAFRRSARNLRYALVAAVLYYLIVVGAALFGGRLALMANWPLTTEAIFLYLQVLLAGLAFVALWLVARELYGITVPKPKEEPDGT